MMTMNEMNRFHDVFGYDADIRDYERTLAALGKLMRAKGAPKSVRIEARKLYVGVEQSGRIAGTGDWIRANWGYVIGGNVTLALIVALFPLAMLMSAGHNLAAVMLFGSTAWGVYQASRALRVRRVRRSHRIPR